MSQRIQLRIDDLLHQYLVDRAEKENRSLSNMIETALKEFQKGGSAANNFVPNRVPVDTPPAEKPRVVGGYTDEEFAELL